MKEVNELDLEDGIELITKAFEKRNEEQAFQLYVVKYQLMNEKNYVPFSEFYKPQQPVQDTRSVDDILGEVKTILDEWER